MKNRQNVLTAALTGLAPAIWGSTYLVTTELLPPDRPLLATTMRALPGGLVLLALGRTLPVGIWWWRALVLGVLNIGAFNFLLFVAAYRLPGGIAAMIMSAQPMFVVILAALLLSEKIRPVHALACALGTGGVVLLVFRGTASLDSVGVLAAVGGALCMASGITLTKRWGRPEGVGLLTFTGWQLAAGGLALLPFWLLLEDLPDGLTGSNVIGFAYLITLGAVLSYIIWFRGIERLPAVAVSFLALGSPVVATLLGYLLKDQTLSALQIVGMAVILLAVVLGQPRPPRPKPGEKPPAPPRTTVSRLPGPTAPEPERSR
ncbi:EamA family transporter [Streptomyces antarcticus]|uniref:EamA family transporter n=1 Tax=Streptomyces antarcticus TaxID=2996458 RepID=UPI00226F92BA|nr:MULTISPECIES: EamA family transporter [unclassified Streptomyces]MCY0946165.1 EamA family transporter [Streptomyces sp. H34-AA3]MCZ4084983.1 EamA family transporter [Streptomyces sp. H34-S5]